MSATPIRYWHNGRNGTLAAAQVPLQGHLGVAYGLGLYETGRWVGGSLAFRTYHEARFANGLQQLGGLAEAQANRTAKQVFSTLASVLAAAGTDPARVRLDAWWQGSDTPYGTTQPLELEVALRFNALATDLFGTHPPVTIGLAPGFHPHTGHLAGLKTTSAAAYAAAAQLVQQRQWHDAILLNHAGQLAETTRYNLWAYIRGRWVTPTAEHGLVKGTLRQWLLDQRIGREATLSLDALPDVQALCLSNAIHGLVPVETLVVDGATRQLEIGPPTRMLLDLLQARVERN